ncbi:restriction endonuclease subunit S [Escherichia coli]|uniref:restriction endonuclease subunit S n=1 Tax=Escherichia coli TaxID=562 RepID=UPI0030134FDA
MGSKWEKIKLKEVVDIITTKVDVSQISLCDYISTENMLTNFGGISIANSKPSTGKITKFHSGDILFSNIRTYFKKLWLADRTGGCSNDVIVFRPKKNINSNYILSVLMDQKFIEYTVLTSKGTKMPRGDKTAILDYEFNLAPDKYCQHIAKINTLILSKLKSNEVINKSLEQMSQTLFKSWFVDFDPVIDNALDAGNPIPEALQSRAELRQKVRNCADFKPLPAEIRSLFQSEFEETELGWVPKGWLITSFNDLIELIGGGTPKTTVEEYWNGDIPWFSVVDAPNESAVYVLSTEKSITAEGLKNSSAKLLRKGTTIISARGTVGKCAMVAVPMAMNQSCYGVSGKNKISDEYVYFQLKNVVQTLQQMGHGSVFNTITRDTFKNIKVPFCNEELTNTYSTYVKKYFSKILNNNYQNIALTKLRDTLLPKLISGELSLEDLPDLTTDTEAA